MQKPPLLLPQLPFAVDDTCNRQTKGWMPPRDTCLLLRWRWNCASYREKLIWERSVAASWLSPYLLRAGPFCLAVAKFHPIQRDLGSDLEAVSDDRAAVLYLERRASEKTIIRAVLYIEHHIIVVVGNYARLINLEPRLDFCSRPQIDLLIALTQFRRSARLFISNTRLQSYAIRFSSLYL